MPAPLAHLRILDLTSGVAGPWCTKLLADFGADVIKIERPSVGDESRAHGPFPRGIPNREASALFLWLNTSKRSITIDATKRSGRALALDIAKHCDAVVHDYRPSQLDALRLQPEAFEAVNENIVVTSVNAFGQRGPYANWHATNLT